MRSNRSERRGCIKASNELFRAAPAAAKTDRPTVKYCYPENGAKMSYENYSIYARTTILSLKHACESRVVYVDPQSRSRQLYILRRVCLYLMCWCACWKQPRDCRSISSGPAPAKLQIEQKERVTVRGGEQHRHTKRVSSHCQTLPRR